MNKVLELLNQLEIKYKVVEHDPVYTVDQAQYVKSMIEGTGAKSLFLKHKTDYYLYYLDDSKRADLKEVSRKLNIGRLSFANEEELYEKLKLKPGSVTPLGIINDNHSVTLIIDKDLKNKTILAHPNVNTITVSMDYNDLIKYIEYHKNKYYEI